VAGISFAPTALVGRVILIPGLAPFAGFYRTFGAWVGVGLPEVPHSTLPHPGTRHPKTMGGIRNEKPQPCLLMFVQKMREGLGREIRSFGDSNPMLDSSERVTRTHT
jgi:hypothetical protein